MGANGREISVESAAGAPLQHFPRHVVLPRARARGCTWRPRRHCRAALGQVALRVRGEGITNVANSVDWFRLHHARLVLVLVLVLVRVLVRVPRAVWCCSACSCRALWKQPPEFTQGQLGRSSGRRGTEVRKPVRAIDAVHRAGRRRDGAGGAGAGAGATVRGCSPPRRRRPGRPCLHTRTRPVASSSRPPRLTELGFKARGAKRLNSPTRGFLLRCVTQPFRRVLWNRVPKVGKAYPCHLSSSQPCRCPTRGESWPCRARASFFRRRTLRSLIQHAHLILAPERLAVKVAVHETHCGGGGRGQLGSRLVLRPGRAG